MEGGAWEKRILCKLHLEVRDDELISLFGASGCGKSTLLKAICGFVPVQAGHIYVDEVCIETIPVYRRGATMVFQELRLFPHLLAWGNVSFLLKMQGIPKKERRRRVNEWLRLVNLAGLEPRKIYEFSGGQQQRVALARVRGNTKNSVACRTLFRA